jgi:hypothetical protein
MRWLYSWFIIGFLLCAAVLTLALGFILLNRSHMVDAEVGKWLLTVSAALVFTGGLAALANQIDQRRSERHAWHEVLRDLGAVNQTIAMVRFRLLSNQSAQTYQEQLPELVRARLEIRRIYAMEIVNEDKWLRPYITAMKEYVDDLGEECVTGHLRVARQQRLDEAWLTERMKVASSGSGAPELPCELACPTKAWRLLTDQSQFPRLVALLDDGAFKIDAFRTNYKLAKGYVETKAGFKARSTEALVSAAEKLVCRSEEFIDLHEVALRPKMLRRIQDEVGKVRKACTDQRRSDIEKGVASLGKAAADAICAVYSVRNGTGPQECAAPPASPTASSLP